MPLILLLLCTGLVQAQNKKKDKQLWQKWDEVVELSQKTSKPILIDIYTDWCRYCRIMDATTFRHDSVVTFLQQRYLRFKFNAESKDTIKWNNKAFVYNSRYDVHDFAVYLTRGSIVYPTIVIITPGGQPFYKHGQIKPAEMEMLLKYFVGATTSKTLEEFAQTFVSQWK